MAEVRPLASGERVRICCGRWAGREGTFVHDYISWTAPQPQVYPVVNLEARGRARARTVRVVAVERVEA